MNIEEAWNKLSLAEKESGPESRQAYIAMCNYARAFLNAGRPYEAIPFFERALAGQKLLVTDKHPETNITKFNLGLAMVHIGDGVNGGEYMKDAANALSDSFGSMHLEVLTMHETMHDLEEKGVIKSQPKSRIQWKSKLTGHVGCGQVVSTDQAQRVAVEMNEKYPYLEHWTVAL